MDKMLQANGTLADGRPFQHGITDPSFPFETPDHLSDRENDYDYYRGRIDRQAHLTVIRANTGASNRSEFANILELLTEIKDENETKTPSTSHLRPFDNWKVNTSYRVTMTIALGASLFVDHAGADRFNIRGQKPSELKIMPPFPGDAENFQPRDRATDFLILIASDSQYVNVAIARYLREFFNPEYLKRFGGRYETDWLDVRSIEYGFSRPDEREFLRFDDGIDNLRPGIGGEMERMVYIDETNHEPEWCRGGTYLVYRKIREHMPKWEQHLIENGSPKETISRQEQMIGREKDTGLPLSRKTTGWEQRTPVFASPTDEKDGSLASHIRKVQPRRKEIDQFGIHDLQRRFLRRPYPFASPVSNGSQFENGLHFIAFMESIQKQFEFVTQMWQMNPDFPKEGVGIDALYAHGVLSTIDGGYYFCPPAPADGEILCQFLVS